MFLPRGSYELIFKKAPVFEGVPEKLKKARELYLKLSEETGKTLPWGILTGVKPTKLYTQLTLGYGTSAETVLKDDYLVSREKIALLRQIYEREQFALPKNDYGKPSKSSAGNDVALYVGIPFCPTRCEYCTFTAGVGSEKQMLSYLKALKKEIEFVAAGMREHGMVAESVYIGGGTPTSLPMSILDELLNMIKEFFIKEHTEFTVEAGRPDSITFEKIQSIVRAGAGRVSVNPQTMNEKTLEIIGRKHKTEEIKEAFEALRTAGISIVNSDIIAGLPGESIQDFEHTLREILDLKPENLTIHTLALKKGAGLREKDPLYNYKQQGIAEKMLMAANEMLSKTGLKPYYLYRQKQTIDNLENTGYALQGTECIYNMRMMQEKQTVIALGAGAVSRMYFPAEDRVERIFNIMDTMIYIERIADMLIRKEKIFS
jgi:oxygen-independent coproporphyrinogen-3 oxidase